MSTHTSTTIYVIQERDTWSRPIRWRDSTAQPVETTVSEKKAFTWLLLRKAAMKDATWIRYRLQIRSATSLTIKETAWRAARWKLQFDFKTVAPKKKAKK
jgi:hypothetical protein